VETQRKLEKLRQKKKETGKSDDQIDAEEVLKRNEEYASKL